MRYTLLPGLLPRALACTLLLGLLTACASLQPSAEPPEVRIEHIRLLSASAGTQRYAVTLSVFNPNQFDVPVRDVVYRLELNGESFADGRLDPGPTLPARQTVPVELTFDTDLATTTRQLVTWFMRGATRVDYRLTGEARLRRFGTPVLRFEEDGSIGLEALRPNRPGV